MTRAHVTVVIDLPPRELSPNARTHWAVKKKAKNAYADHVFAEAVRAQGAERRHWKRARIQTAFYWRTRHEHDEDNIMAQLKYARDAMARAGIVENDRGFTCDPPGQFVDPETPRVLLHVTCLDAEEVEAGAE